MKIQRQCFACYTGDHSECDGTIMGQTSCNCGCVSPSTYLYIPAIIAMTNPVNQTPLDELYSEALLKHPTATGSTHNHQAWEGGYFDHVREVCNIAITLYHTLSLLRPLPFPLADALEVLLVHDIEKLERPEGGFTSKVTRAELRKNTIKERLAYFSEEQYTAVITCEGENTSYSPNERKMNELGAFCHMCDVASARLWHDSGKTSCW
jgi:hypothetical protein